MKLLYVFAAVLAVALTEELDTQQLDDLVAAETIELMKKGADLDSAASAYNYIPPNQAQSQWPQNNENSWNQQNYVPQNTWIQPQEKPIQPVNTYVPPPSPIVPPQNDYVYQHHNYVPTYPPTYAPTYKPTYPPTHPPTHAPTWSTPHYHHPTTTTPIPVIKNELYYGENGSYKYEYQIADGTHVGEEGYFTNPKADDESLVKKGWYSFTGADGKVYTVTYWADKTGFHAYGDHLPTPPPVPPAIQAALDQSAKEEAEKNKPQPGHQTHYPAQHPSYPTTPATYYPPQQTYYPQPSYPSYGKK